MRKTRQAVPFPCVCACLHHSRLASACPKRLPTAPNHPYFCGFLKLPLQSEPDPPFSHGRAPLVLRACADANNPLTGDRSSLQSVCDSTQLQSTTQLQSNTQYQPLTQRHLTQGAPARSQCRRWAKALRPTILPESRQTAVHSCSGRSVPLAQMPDYAISVQLLVGLTLDPIVQH
jgi:hypothetical protein